MLPDAVQMFKASLFVLGIALKREGQQTQLRADHFDDGVGNFTCVWQEIAVPPKRTELNSKSQPVGGTAALSYLLKVQFRQGKVFAESIVVDLIGQAFWLFQPVIWTGMVNGRRCRIQDFPPPMARK